MTRFQATKTPVPLSRSRCEHDCEAYEKARLIAFQAANQAIRALMRGAPTAEIGLLSRQASLAWADLADTAACLTESCSPK